jgi:parvulin-like peptidyl-prolyl isomerase
MFRLIVLTAVTVLLFSCAPAMLPPEQLGRQPVVTVGGMAITRAEVARMMDALERPELSQEELQQEAIEELIAQELLYQEARRRGLTVPEDEVTAQYNRLREEFLSRAVFQEAKEDNGLDDETLRQQIERDLMIVRLLDEAVYARLTVNPKEMVTRPREVHEFYIYRRVYPGAPQERRQEAWEMMRQARERILAGEDFGEMVEEYSQSGLAKYGGDAGFMPYNPKSELSRALFDLEEGQISEIVETKWGLFILKAAEIRPEHQQAFGELDLKLQRIVLQRRMQEQLDRFVEQLKAQSEIEPVS